MGLLEPPIFFQCTGKLLEAEPLLLLHLGDNLYQLLCFGALRLKSFLKYFKHFLQLPLVYHMTDFIQCKLHPTQHAYASQGIRILSAKGCIDPAAYWLLLGMNQPSFAIKTNRPGR